MNLNDYEETGKVIDFTPRPKASQAVAAAKRATQQHDEPESEPRRPARIPQRDYRLPALAAGLIVLAMLGMASWQLGRTPAKPLQLQSTDSPARVLVAPATRSPAPTSAPIATHAPTSTAVPTEAPPVGQGLTLDPIVPTDPPAPPPAEPPAVQLVVSGESEQHTTVIGADACKVAMGARRCGR